MKSPRPLLLVLVMAAAFVMILALRTDDTVDGRPVPADAEPLATTPTDGIGPADPVDTVADRTTVSAPPPRQPGYVVTRPGAEVRSVPGGPVDATVGGGVLFPILAEVAGGYRVFTSCNTEAWIGSDQVDVGTVPVTEERSMEHAVVVVDPGHGLPDLGAVGPTGLTETEVNMAVSARLVELLERANDIDWATGAVRPGDQVPPAATAILTRGPSGPNGGEYQLGLSFRAQVANSVGADALVSIHHNSVPETTLDHPGAEAFVSVDDPESQRLGGLIVDELRRGFARFDADWTGSPGSGIVIRQGTDGLDFYSLLKHSESPAVIVEGAYISNPSEEALARTDEFRQAYAEGVYRALVRFITTDDDPIRPPEPVVWSVDTGSPSMANCTLPSP